jgi:hypothetical protein
MIRHLFYVPYSVIVRFFKNMVRITYPPHNGSYLLSQPIAGCITAADRAQDSSRSCAVDEIKLFACLACRKLRILRVSAAIVASS